ncbi:Copper resistance protein CopD [Serinicoccus hydrothermalis]|uniref:Copper resistance protein CopD n=1 Tax=Serinicoccus hydrothermalis TaxID=1758689 RepID=A0A1B1NCJ3_9MICO|nr:CopD family protein [Serinicoccus hydrothermalis]ANS79153.1 Copper resistance protein CopD [Serinicoccus hydrothermalis]
MRRFSGLALACLALLLLSGVVAALVVAGALSWSWLGEGWVHLLAVKVALVVVLGLIGWQHRRATIPALEAGRPWTFVRLGVVEVALMALTLTVSVALAASPAPAPATGAPVSAVPPAEVEGPTEQGSSTAQTDDIPRTEDRPAAEPPTADSSAAEMIGHDHGELSVSILIDDERFHVPGTVRPGQAVTVYNSSDTAATITSPDFDVDVPPRTFITFPAPSAEGDYGFVSQAEGQAVDGFADTLRVRADP